MSAEHGSATGHGGGHEEDRVPARPFVVGGVVFVVLLVISYIVPTALENYFFAREAAQSPPANPLVQAAGRQLPPEPRLQVNPDRDIAEMRKREREILDSYAWVDKPQGLVRLPIERAIDLLAARGSAAPLMDAPAPTAAPGAPASPGAAGAPAGAAGGPR